jgi:hypothetical protein
VNAITKKKKKNKVRLSLRVDPDRLAKLHALAEEKGVTMTKYIESWIDLLPAPVSLPTQRNP